MLENFTKDNKIHKTKWKVCTYLNLKWQKHQSKMIINPEKKSSYYLNRKHREVLERTYTEHNYIRQHYVFIKT